MKAAYAFNTSRRKKSNPRWEYWAHQYFKYAKIAIKLAHKLPVKHRISLKVFLGADKYGVGIIGS